MVTLVLYHDNSEQVINFEDNLWKYNIGYTVMQEKSGETEYRLESNLGYEDVHVMADTRKIAAKIDLEIDVDIF